jgi:branched-chain amino acid transport system ATP-binding protein
VIGPNGAGKSTLTNLLSGDLPTTSARSRWPGAT